MKFPYVMDSTLITIPAIFCMILLWKVFSNIRSSLPWRVNCWFCNSNIWVKYHKRNCWTCPKCEQYNGFTKDGDYNRALCINTEQGSISPKAFLRSPPKNGLCKMCNINQQLKVTQLANFVPINENKYDEEIESYRILLEKAYKLCSPCQKVLQKKLLREKESLLDTKLLETRTSGKRVQRHQKQSELLEKVINSVSKSISIMLLGLVVVECYKNALEHKCLSNTMYNVKEIIRSLVTRIFSIIKMKMLLTFPSLAEHYIDIHKIDTEELFTNYIGLNDVMQKSLGGVVLFIQIVGHFWNVTSAQYSIVIDSLWSTFMLTSILQEYVDVDPLIMSLIKLFSTLAVFLVYRHLNSKTVRNVKKPVTPKKVKNFSKAPKKNDEEDDIMYDTDDDVSLSQFGLFNMSDSSSENTSTVNHSLLNGRCFTPRNDSIWTKPKHNNSTFTVNSVMSGAKRHSETISSKQSFNKYQNMEDSDSDLDANISSLCISSPKKKTAKINPVFALRKFTASPNFAVPTPLNRTKPVISPSKLAHSWVAGGYWGVEGERQMIFNVNGSRSSSQSSGFESQTSSMTQRNVFSQPPSREESICGDQYKHLVFDRYQNSNMMNYNNHPQLFIPVSSPIYPQMQYNSHVQIPQPRLTPQSFISPNVYANQQFAPNAMFKSPGGPRLINLPQDHFVSR